MIPSVFIFLENLPLTPNGKVDRKALPVPEAIISASGGKVMGSCNPTEQVLLGIWAEVLGIETISVHDNFFDLGGHSLSAIQVIARLQESFDVELPVASLFESPTIAELAALIVQQQSDHLNNQELVSLLEEIEGLSDEQATKLLNRL
jgi:acyl carrier protein